MTTAFLARLVYLALLVVDYQNGIDHEDLVTEFYRHIVTNSIVTDLFDFLNGTL